jgi:hypothetical protein
VVHPVPRELKRLEQIGPVVRPSFQAIVGAQLSVSNSGMYVSTAATSS